MFYYSYLGYFNYLLWMLPALILSAVAQFKVKSAYSKNSKIQNSRGLTGAEAARQVLLRHNITNVSIVPVAGKLTDHFDPRTNTIRLSEGVYNATTIAAVGIAAHEAGHAVQHAEGYAPNKLRSVLVPITNFGSRIGWILIIIGLIMSGYYSYSDSSGSALTNDISGMFLLLGVILYSTSLIFTLVTLPVEFNASKRALATIKSNNLLVGEEFKGAKQTLTAAALTYVAAAVTALLQLLRVIIMISRRRD
ncbi:MAG: zinc metallopeptidase [Ruminococcus sp.]|nr:zinc metallopeptidase [Ruminococcus sp.]